MTEKKTVPAKASKGKSKKSPSQNELKDEQLKKVSGGATGPGTQTEDEVYIGRSVRR